MAVFEFEIHHDYVFYATVKADSEEDAENFIYRNECKFIEDFSDRDFHVSIYENDYMKDSDADFDASKEYLAVNVKEV